MVGLIVCWDVGLNKPQAQADDNENDQDHH